MALPAIYNSHQYFLEKATGERLPNGLPPLKRLTARHVAILNFHILGKRNFEVALKFHIREATVSRIINDPLGQEYLRTKYQGFDNEFAALYGQSVNTLRDGMSPVVAMRDRLRAAELYFKKRGDLREKEEGKKTAEDVIQQILAQVNVQVNIQK